MSRLITPAEPFDDTTRRFGRTLVEVCRYERATWFYPPQRTSLPYTAVNVTLAVAVVAVIISVCFGVQP